MTVMPPDADVKQIMHEGINLLNVSRLRKGQIQLKAFILLGLVLLSACQSEPEYKASLRPVVLENGMQVTTCHDYEQMRAVFRLQETVSNQMAAAEYLPCSLAIGISPDDSPEVTMRAIFHGLNVRDLPTSLGPSVARGVSLSKAGFELWLERSMLTYSDDQAVIQIQYKGQLKNKNHLVWVSDNALEGNYVSYYPAIIMMQDGKAIGAAPLYASGF